MRKIAQSKHSQVIGDAGRGSVKFSRKMRELHACGAEVPLCQDTTREGVAELGAKSARHSEAAAKHLDRELGATDCTDGISLLCNRCNLWPNFWTGLGIDIAFILS